MARLNRQCPKLPWMIDFYSTNDGQVPNNQLTAAFADNHLTYQANLNFESKPGRKRLSGIICTVGPSSSSVDVLEDMITSGMCVARLKTPFFTHIECIQVIDNIRMAAENVSRKMGTVFPVAIALDLKGPEIRTGVLKNSVNGPLELQQGKETMLTSDPSYEEHVTDNMIYVDYQKLTEIVEPGDRFYLDNHVTLSALEIVGSFIRCIVETAGKIGDRVNVSLENSILDLPSFSELEVERAKELQVDAVFVASVKSDEVIHEVRKLLGESGKWIMVIAKIENEVGAKNIEKIAKAADGVMICRSDLMIEIAAEKLFLVQKMIIACCNRAGKPVICAPQVLESMTTSKIAKRCEMLDVANTILEGADCFMLSRETACGDYPVEAVETLSKICKEAESAVYQRVVFESLAREVTSPVEPIYALSVAVVEASFKANAAAIILLTTSGRSAKILAKFRPRCPIIAITRHGNVSRQLKFFRGVEPIHFIKKPMKTWPKDVENRIRFGITYAKFCGIIRAADVIIILNGSRPGTGFTNTMSLYYATHYDTLDDE